jgi:hypothetical protein
MSGRQTSTSTSVPIQEIRCVRTRHLASVATSNITTVRAYLLYQHPEMAHNKLTTSCREWDSRYNTRVQTHVRISLLHPLRTVKQLDRIQLGATVAKNLRESVTLEVCTHSDSTRDYALRSRHINWAAETSSATSPRKQTSQIRRTLLQARKAALALS